MNCLVCYKHCYHKKPCGGCRNSDKGKPEHCRKCRIKDCIGEKGLSQEEVAEKLGISRQTVSKWETDETLPDICQSKKMAVLYGLSLDELVEFDIDIKEIQEVIDRTSEEVSDKIDWTKAWSGQYPILSRYREEVDTDRYAAELDKLLRDLEKKYGYNELDSFLVLKDILAFVWKGRKKSSR